MKPIVLTNVYTTDEGHPIRPFNPAQNQRSSEQSSQPAPRVTPNKQSSAREGIQEAEGDGKIIFVGRAWRGNGTPEEDSRGEVTITIEPLVNGRTGSRVMNAVPGPVTLKTGALEGSRRSQDNGSPPTSTADRQKINVEYRAQLRGGAATQDRASAVPAMSGKRPTIAEINKRNQEFRARKAAGLPV
jgi:hypothetical protein